VGFLRADALALPFPDSSFACVTTGFSLRNVADVRRCLAEMARVVQPGGRIAILEMTPLPSHGLFLRLFRLYFHGLVPWMGQIVAGDRAAYTYLPRSVDGFLAADPLARLMEEVGLAEVRYRRLGWGTVALHVGRRP
jgi:demethylmenaquinone methyltransferase/2-methoxy-6-polyprenyl-1,4-benzoquinol methylase